MSTLHLDAEALYGELLRGVLRLFTPGTTLVGVWSGGAWLAERLQRDLGLAGEAAVISSSLHRDDFSERGMTTKRRAAPSFVNPLGGQDGQGPAVGARYASSDQTRLPFEVEGSRILLIDDVLFTGRTTRAVLNELFDFGRPASVQLAVLVDRGGRELPMEAAFSAARVSLAAEQRLRLAKNADGRLTFDLE